MNETLKNIRARRSILHSIRKNNLLALTILLVVSCCKSHDETVGPKLLWSVELPRVDSPEVLWQGEGIMPVYDNIIVAHTTMHDDWDEPLTIADNRLCGINLNDQSVEWLYPQTDAVEMDIIFNHYGYQIGNLFVVKYVETSSDGEMFTSVAALDIVTGDEKWKYREQTYDSTNHCDYVVGDGNYCYYVNDGQRVYMSDVNNGETHLLYSAGDMGIENQPLFVGDNRMAIIRHDKEDDLSFSEVIIMDLTTKCIDKIFNLPITKEYSDWTLGAVNDGNTLYCNIHDYSYSIDIDSEMIGWESRNPGFDGMGNYFLHNGVLFRSGWSSAIALDVWTGKPLYGYPELGSTLVSAYGERVYYTTSTGLLYVMNLKDGHIISKTTCPCGQSGFFGAYPTVYGDNLFIMGGNKLHCYKL